MPSSAASSISIDIVNEHGTGFSQMIRVDDEQAFWWNQGQGRMLPPADPGGAICKPKAAIIEHRSYCSTAMAQREAPNLSPQISSRTTFLVCI